MIRPLPTVLHVENDKNDQLLARIAFQRVQCPVNLQAVEDGEQAMDYLMNAGRFSDRVLYPFPDLILLDLKLPRKSGMQVLEWVRTRPEFDGLPILVLSSSEHSDDRDRAMALGANAYHAKPLALDPLTGLIREICKDWLT